MKQHTQETIEKYLNLSEGYVDYQFGLDNVCLDGWFDLEELTSLILTSQLTSLVAEVEELENFEGDIGNFQAVQAYQRVLALIGSNMENK